MSNLRKSMFSPSSSRAGSRVSSRSNSRAPTSRLMSSAGSMDSEDEADFSFNGLDELIINKLNSYLDSVESTILDSDVEGKTNLTTHSISDLFHSLSMARTTVSTDARELLLARLYQLIIAKPLITEEGLVNEFNVEQLIKYYTGARTENEKLLTLKVMTTYSCSDIEEVSSLLISDVLPVLTADLRKVEEVSANLRANIMICYASLLLCIYDGSGAYGLDETSESILELIEGLVNSTDGAQEADVIINGLHAIGVIISVIYHGDNDINELIEDVLPRLVDFLENDDLNISKAAGRVIALLYELYDYADDEDEDDEDSYEQSPFYDFDHLRSTVNSLSTLSSKNVNKKLKRESKSIFRDILVTLDSYSTRESRLELLKHPLTLSHLKLSKSRSLLIQSWYSFVRLIHLRYVFSAGLHENLLCNSELGALIKKPKSHDKFSKFDRDEDAEVADEGRTFGADQKRKISGKKKDIEINHARSEKVLREMGDLSIN